MAFVVSSSEVFFHVSVFICFYILIKSGVGFQFQPEIVYQSINQSIKALQLHLHTHREKLWVQYPAQGYLVMWTGGAEDHATNLSISGRPSPPPELQFLWMDCHKLFSTTSLKEHFQSSLIFKMKHFTSNKLSDCT